MKTDNTLPQTLRLALVGVNPSNPSEYPYTYYQCSGEWEKLVILYNIPINVLPSMMVQIQIFRPDTVVFVDGVGIKYTP